ncbi:reticulon-like protein B16 isoform X1 [Pyrus x bretschneideri]|uniref:reticulon-like protein B16 isoform X1 n=1 Tax=Pyrus x bretschneideri TaxID=225117 RepID=UPI00202EEF36|nr:reticulon-like protein B16 isoform X1 [Pyrus x bretschneideri]
MENSQELCSTEGDGDGRKAVPSTSYTAASCGAAYRLFGRQDSVHNCLGGGRAADILLWKRGRVSFVTIIVATVAWLVFERSGLSFLSICADVLLILVVLLFLRANYADFRNKQLQTLPELVVSEEMVHNVAASFRVKINNVLLMAHDITLGKDFRLFFKVVVCLWLLSVIGSFFSFFTLAYIGSILSITLPALYSKYEETVDRCFGNIHRQFSKHYKIVDDGVFNRLPRNVPKDKDS